MCEETFNKLQGLIKKATEFGADAAEVVYVHQESLSHSQRFGKTENIERAENADIGLRVFKGKKQSVVSSSDQTPSALNNLAERAVAMAKAVPQDEYCGLADPDQLQKNEPPELEMFDESKPDTDTLIEWARSAEGAALEVNGITNSEGAEAGWMQSEVLLAATNGFVGKYRRSSFSISTCVLGGEGTAMERDYDYTSAVF